MRAPAECRGGEKQRERDCGGACAASEKINSCTVITAAANELLAPLHERMPLILAEQDWPAWLGEREADQDELRALLKPAANELLHLWAVSKRVGSVKNNDAALCKPVILAA
jgi:putative SOS response-associated peptidase YedK